MGESDKPLFPYSTTEMERDTVDLMDGIGWRGERQFTCCGCEYGFDGSARIGETLRSPRGEFREARAQTEHEGFTANANYELCRLCRACSYLQESPL